MQNKKGNKYYKPNKKKTKKKKNELEQEPAGARIPPAGAIA